MSDVTRILNQIESGDPTAANQLLPLVYDELRKLAAAKLAHEKPGQTLQPTALVHEAYLRLLGNDHQGKAWNSQNHFFAAAAEAMRRILVEQARRKGGPSRGGDRQRVDLDCVSEQSNELAAQILDVHEALDGLAEEHEMAAQLVKLRYFAGMTQQEAAECLGISRSTADRYWTFAKTALFVALRDSHRT